MFKGRTVCAIVPALDEADAIGGVVTGLRALRNDGGEPLIDRVIVADNGSTDGTDVLARSVGASVVTEPNRGYGYACMAGIAAVSEAEILLFVDGDNSVIPQETFSLLAALDVGADLVIGVRSHAEAGAMTLPQRLGNGLACRLARLIWNVPMSDLGPFRAIRKTAFDSLDMQDMTYGWTIEMQLKAFQRGQRVVEVPVSVRRRLGHSKISGTVRGVIGAGVGIFSMIAKLWWQGRSRATSHRVGRV